MANEEAQKDQQRYENEVIQLHTVVGVLKREKKNAKSNLTRMLNQLTLSVSEELYDRHKVVEVIERLERLRDEVMRILEELETVYSKLRDEEKERKTSEEIEEINAQVDRELSQARVIMLTQVSSLRNALNDVSGEKEKTQRMRETQQDEDDNRAGNRVQIKKEESVTQTINTLVNRSALATQ